MKKSNATEFSGRIIGFSSTRFLDCSMIEIRIRKMSAGLPDPNQAKLLQELKERFPEVPDEVVMNLMRDVSTLMNLSYLLKTLSTCIIHSTCMLLQYTPLHPPQSYWWMDGWIRHIVGFQPLMVISPTASCWCVCTETPLVPGILEKWPLVTEGGEYMYIPGTYCGFQDLCPL